MKKFQWKKVFAFAMVLTMGLSFAGCGGEEAEETVEPAETETAVDEIQLVSTDFGTLTMDLPDDFGEVAVQEGMTTAAAAGSSVIVSDPYETDFAITDITEEAMLALVEGSYAYAEIVVFQNPVTAAGRDAVCTILEGTSASTGKTNTVCYVMMFFTQDDVPYEQDVAFTFNTDAGTSLEATLEEVVDSISVAE